VSKEQCARKHLPNLKRRRRDAVIPSTGQMTAGGFAGGRYFATTQVKIRRTSFLSPRIMAESALSLNIKIAIAPEIAMEGRFSTELELNSTARQPAAGSAGSARPITSRRFARFLRQTDEAGDEKPDIDLSGVTLIPLAAAGEPARDGGDDGWR